MPDGTIHERRETLMLTEIERLRYALENLTSAVDSGENVNGAMALAKGMLAKPLHGYRIKRGF